MKSTILKKKEIDFEELGYQTMVETGDKGSRKTSVASTFMRWPSNSTLELMRLSSAIEEKKGRRQSLCSHLYDRHVPVSDAKILGLAIAAGILAVMTVVAAAASLGATRWRFISLAPACPRVSSWASS